MSSRTETGGPPVGRAWLFATFALAAALRFLGLQSGLWFDEIVTLVLSARQGLRQILTEIPGINAHPLYSVLAHASIWLFGESAWALRLPACVFGIASVVMVYRLGSRLTSRVEAWAGAAVLATSYHHIWFSQNARGYTLLGFLTLVSTGALLRAGERGHLRDYLLYALASVAGMYTHLTMGFVIGGQAVVLLFAWATGRWPLAEMQPPPTTRRHFTRLVWTWAGVAVLTALAYAPFARTLVAQLGSRAPHETAKMATTGWAIGEAIRSLLSGAGLPAAVAAAALALAGAWSLWRRHPLAVALLVGPGLTTGIGIAALGQPMRPRFFFFLSGAAAIFVGRGIGALMGALARRPGSLQAFSLDKRIVTCALVLVAASAVALPRNYRTPKQDFDGAVRFLDTAETSGVRIAAAGPACFPFQAYYGRKWPCLGSPGDWQTFRAGSGRALVVYTLAENMEDRALLRTLRAACPDVRRFDATLGGGEITVCEARREPPGR